LQQQPERLIGDAVLRVVEVDADRLGGQAFAAARVVGEEAAQVQVADLLVMRAQGLPGGAAGEWQIGRRHWEFPLGSGSFGN
jgi:hypothetical protein